MSSLLFKENPIINHPPEGANSPQAEDAETFIYELLSTDTYPVPGKGISIFGGYIDNGIRAAPYIALSSYTSPILTKTISMLSKENHFKVEVILENDLKISDADIEGEIKEGTILYRARIGIAKSYQNHENPDWTARVRRRPFQGSQIGAPPPLLATAGRVNRAGVSFLYLSSDQTTAAVEVRPHPGHYISIAGFKAQKRLRVADFGRVDISKFINSDKDLRLFHLAYSIDESMSMPITPEERSQYTVTQLIADLMRRRGFDGIRFRSSVGSGFNVCVFDSGAFAELPKLGDVLFTKKLSYQLDSVDAVLEPSEDDIEIK
ncbi:RES family NAD+ phosphorylase [Corallococcus silvisoli]|uniref:RES family NAD+ phosphorylase n=1 Tax=Corallococcus silvisoli TaxID=2697031 RepID=UPI001377DE96|nr:RES family NAD+ phosphorylase [Corallococcus silvisoli]NBD13823.1 RES domain-containing protein [Corallococcus silvisoli]